MVKNSFGKCVKNSHPRRDFINSLDKIKDRESQRTIAELHPIQGITIKRRLPQAVEEKLSLDKKVACERTSAVIARKYNLDKCHKLYRSKHSQTKLFPEEN